eukprot:557176-Pelagomonas_calceolata.AAC.13
MAMHPSDFVHPECFICFPDCNGYYCTQSGYTRVTQELQGDGLQPETLADRLLSTLDTNQGAWRKDPTVNADTNSEPHQD